MNLDARLKKVEEHAQERVMADFCLCKLDEAANMAFDSYLRARGVVYEPENPCIVGRPCAICGRDLSHNLTNLDDQERAVWLRLNDLTRSGWEEKRRTGRPPEVSDEWVRHEKWMRRRSRAADERAFGKYCHAAVIFGCWWAK